MTNIDIEYFFNDLYHALEDYVIRPYQNSIKNYDWYTSPAFQQELDYPNLEEFCWSILNSGMESVLSEIEDFIKERISKGFNYNYIDEKLYTSSWTRSFEVLLRPLRMGSNVIMALLKSFLFIEGISYLPSLRNPKVLKLGSEEAHNMQEFHDWHKPIEILYARIFRFLEDYIQKISPEEFQANIYLFLNDGMRINPKSKKISELMSEMESVFFPCGGGEESLLERKDYREISSFIVQNFSGQFEFELESEKQVLEIILNNKKEFHETLDMVYEYHKKTFLKFEDVGFSTPREIRQSSREILNTFVNDLSEFVKEPDNFVIDSFELPEEINLELKRAFSRKETEMEKKLYEYTTSTNHQIQLVLHLVSQSEVNKLLRVVEGFYRLMEKRQLSSRSLNLIQFIQFSGGTILRKSGKEVAGMYHGRVSKKSGGLSKRNGIELFSKHANLNDLVHEFGHLIHFNSSPTSQGFWRDFMFKSGIEYPISPEMQRGSGDDKFKPDRALPSEYARTNLKESFAETFMFYILEPNRLTKDMIYAIRKFLSLSNFYGDEHIGHIYEKKNLEQIILEQLRDFI